MERSSFPTLQKGRQADPWLPHRSEKLMTPPGVLSGPKEAVTSALHAREGYASRLADLWAQLDQAAAGGDTEAQAFLRMFGPFAANELQHVYAS
jgi:hypothetical protein